MTGTSINREAKAMDRNRQRELEAAAACLIINI